MSLQSELADHYSQVAVRLGKYSHGPTVARLRQEIEALQRELKTSRERLEAMEKARTEREREMVRTGSISRMERILRAVCDHYDVSRDDLISQRRTRRVADARQMAAYLAKQLTIMSYPQIGQRLGGRDHTTIMHAVCKIGRDPDRYGFEITELRAAIEVSPMP